MTDSNIGQISVAMDTLKDKLVELGVAGIIMVALDENNNPVIAMGGALVKLLGMVDIVKLKLEEDTRFELMQQRRSSIIQSTGIVKPN